MAQKFLTDIELEAGLDVDGIIDIAEYIRHKNDGDTYIRFLDDRIDIKAGNLSFIDLREGTSPIGYFNVSNNDIDLQVRGTTNNNLIITNAGPRS